MLCSTSDTTFTLTAGIWLTSVVSRTGSSAMIKTETTVDLILYCTCPVTFSFTYMGGATHVTANRGLKSRLIRLSSKRMHENVTGGYKIDEVVWILHGMANRIS